MFSAVCVTIPSDSKENEKQGGKLGKHERPENHERPEKNNMFQGPRSKRNPDPSLRAQPAHEGTEPPSTTSMVGATEMLIDGHHSSGAHAGAHAAPNAETDVDATAAGLQLKEKASPEKSKSANIVKL